MTRHFWLLLHRYAGLAMAGFLIVVALTGSLLAFLQELEHLINPQFYVADSGLPRLALASLAERAEALAPQAKVEGLWLGQTDSVMVGVVPRNDPATGRPYALDYNKLVLNPYTGEELGRYTRGAISQGLINFMPFVYKLHYALALDKAGILVLGVVALVWTLDCFVAFYLTLPPGRKRHFLLAGEGKSGWQRWRPAWQIKWRASATRINFDLHRAGGLWLWLALLVFAWSSVHMNLWDSVYPAAMRWVSEYHDPRVELPKRGKPLEQPALDWRQADRIGAELMAHAGREGGFSVERPVALRIDREHGVYVYQVRSSRDIQDRAGETRIFFDADSGEARGLSLPTGQYSGNTITAWLFALHMGNVFGLPYRIFVCLLGLAITMLSVTGVVIWLKKRQAGKLRQMPLQFRNSSPPPTGYVMGDDLAPPINKPVMCPADCGMPKK